jgi:hypothetical protein
MSPTETSAIILLFLGFLLNVILEIIKRILDGQPPRGRLTRLDPYIRVMLLLAVVFALGVWAYRIFGKPQISISGAIPAGSPGPLSLGHLSGTVSGPRPEFSWVLVYACVGHYCYIQPMEHEFRIRVQGGSWRTSTHLGDHYEVMLVTDDIGNPPSVTSVLPGGRGVLTQVEVPAQQ